MAKPQQRRRRLVQLQRRWLKLCLRDWREAKGAAVYLVALEEAETREAAKSNWPEKAVMVTTTTDANGMA